MGGFSLSRYSIFAFAFSTLVRFYFLLMPEKVSHGFNIEILKKNSSPYMTPIFRTCDRLTVNYNYYYHFAVASDCSDGADVAFVVDNADISVFKFSLGKDFIKKVMVKLVNWSLKFNAAIVLYNRQATVELNFTQTFEMNDFVNVLDSLESQDQCDASLTRIDQALQITSDLVYANHVGTRPKIAILLTHSSFPFALKIFPPRNASESLKQRGVRLLIVGIAVEAYLQELHNITEKKDDLILVKSVSSLPDFEVVLVDKICSAIGKYRNLFF